MTPEIREVNDSLSDTVYLSEKAVLELEDSRQVTTVYCAIEKQNHRISFGKEEPTSSWGFCICLRKNGSLVFLIINNLY